MIMYTIIKPSSPHVRVCFSCPLHDFPPNKARVSTALVLSSFPFLHLLHLEYLDHSQSMGSVGIVTKCFL